MGLIFSNTICFNTIQAFVKQTIWLTMIGPSLCLMSICMFAAIRCPVEKEDDNQTQGNGPKFQNIDKDAMAPTKDPYNYPNNYSNQHLDETGRKFLPPINQHRQQQQPYYNTNPNYNQQNQYTTTGIPVYQTPQLQSPHQVNLNQTRQRLF